MTAYAPEKTESEPTLSTENPIGIKGLAFIEFTGPDPAFFDTTFHKLGFSKIRQHETLPIAHYQQGLASFILNQSTNQFAQSFREAHGQSACSFAFEVENAQHAFDTAIKRGAEVFPPALLEHDYPAVYGVGGSAVYFVEGFFEHLTSNSHGFKALENPETIPTVGFEFIDHFTNNVEQGQKDQWGEYYRNIFGFTELQYFDIRGEKTGLLSYALQSPCKTFCIPINEATEEKSQIAEYIREYHGPGIQHIALHSSNLLTTLDKMAEAGIETLDIDEDYYETVFDRVPNVKEDKAHIQRHQVLVDGDDKGYLLQIFTKNQFGPIFFEFIQRADNQGFGEGNFGALFKSIERDQERRGVL